MDISRPAKVGAMTVALVAAAYGGYRFISPGAGTDGGYSVYSYLPDVTGVAPRSRVMISGIPVGVVDKISLDHGKARVDVRMNPNVALYTDAAIGKKATSLIGENYIILTPGTEGRPRIPDQGEITHYIAEPTLESLQSQVKDILVDVKAVTNSLSKSVGSDDGQKQMADILKNLAEVTEQLNATVKENRAGINETITTINNITQASRPEIAAILDNVRHVTDDVKKMTSTNEGTPQGKPGELRSTMERVNRASASLESALQHADNIAAKIDRGEGTVGRLIKDDALINEVQGITEDVGEFVGGLSRMQTIVGLRTDYNFLANTIKSYVELRLQPTEDKYYLIQLVNDPRGMTTFVQRDVDTTNTNEPPHYREVVTETTNALRFSFQFAKRLGPFTGRFGIMESTGGLGLDLHLLDDRLELRQDLFGFGEELSPRWRITLSYEFIRKLWLLGGVDDIMNDERRDYFVGLQLRFNDQDLKLIVPFAGGTL
jgi:phospholipid/cholesterol/gamma-HCH transport system substrate-binding protein